MKLISVVYLLSLTFIFGCSGNALWKDDNIDTDTKLEINGLNEQIIKGFFEGDQNLILSISSEQLKSKSKNDLIGMIMQVGKSFDQSKFKIKNQFLVKNISTNTLTQAFSGLSGDKDYIIKYQLEPKETFVTVGYFEDSFCEIAFTTVFGKHEGIWQLDILHIGQITVDKKDASDWYLLAKSNYEKGYLADAALNVGICNSILQPAGKYWQYQKEKEIKDFIDTVMVAVNNKYSFPLAVTNIPNNPEIFNITPQPIEEGIFPFVFYTTKVDIDDTASLAKECDIIHKNIGGIFEGIDKNKKYIFYRAYNKMPREGDTTRYFGMIRTNE